MRNFYTKAVGNNALEHNIPPFLSLQEVFNVYDPRPCFPPLLDTSEIAEQFTRDQVQQMEELNAMGTIASKGLLRDRKGMYFHLFLYLFL